MLFASILILAALPGLFAAPTAIHVRTTQLKPSTLATTPFSAAQVKSVLERPAYFARAVYCPPADVKTMSCGGPCDVLKGVKVLASGGDSASTPYYFVAYDPSQSSIIVAHQGTDPHSVMSVANDLKFGMVAPDAASFPGAPATVKVHMGFQQTFLRTAPTILSAVKSGLASTGATKVQVTGHSLGAAVATFDTMMLRLALPKNIAVTAATFGQPRTGNQDWANFVDATIGAGGDTSKYAHVSNQNDPVPYVPPRDFGYQQVGGEIHIKAVDAATGQPTSVVSCPGQDNSACSEGDSVLRANVENHLGPYLDGIIFGRKQCGTSAAAPAGAAPVAGAALAVAKAGKVPAKAGKAKY